MCGVNIEPSTLIVTTFASKVLQVQNWKSAENLHPTFDPQLTRCWLRHIHACYILLCNLDRTFCATEPVANWPPSRRTSILSFSCPLSCFNLVDSVLAIVAALLDRFSKVLSSAHFAFRLAILSVSLAKSSSSSSKSWTATLPSGVLDNSQWMCSFLTLHLICSIQILPLLFHNKNTIVHISASGWGGVLQGCTFTKAIWSLFFTYSTT